MLAARLTVFCEMKVETKQKNEYICRIEDIKHYNSQISVWT